MSGYFITFEGADGSGKTTQINLLYKYLTDNNIETVITREPGGTKISEKIRDLIIDKHNSMTPYTEAYLYAASRAEHVQSIIKPNLELGKIVLCDRFLDSSLAYQGLARGLGIENILELNKFAIGKLLPHLTFFMDISPALSIPRRLEDSEFDRIEQEKMDFHLNVYDGYKQLAKMYNKRFFIVDATDNIENIHNNIIEILKSKEVIQ